MTLRANGQNITRVFANLGEINRVFVNAVQVFQRFLGQWDGTDSLVSNIGFKTGGSGLNAAFADAAVVGTITIDTDGNFTGSSEATNPSGGIEIEASGTGLRIRHYLAATPSTWSPVVPFNFSDGFGAFAIYTSGDLGSAENVSLIGSGFSLTFSSNTRFAAGTGANANLS